jgi:hypothetical protein
MELWNELVKTALLGTQRQRPPQSAGDDALGATLSKLGGAASPDAALLGMAAAVITYQRAGWVPSAEDTEKLPQPCDRKDLPQPSERAAQALYRVLGGERKELLREWLSAASSAGKRVPDLALPQLLEIGAAKPELRDVIALVLGRRGQWLAAQNPEWAFAGGGATPAPSATDGAATAAADESFETAWETGVRPARVSLLTRLRKIDPAKARALLQSTWSQESAEDRTKFLSTFSAGLFPADEPVLEAALDDRSKEVRRVAADLLCRLPSSQLVARMTARAAPLLAWKPGKKPKVEVKLPPAPDKPAERDGVEPKSRNPRLGQKQWWLSQLVAAVPPGAWLKSWGATPAEIVEGVRKNEFETVLVSAWAQAAARHVDPAWAEALLATEAATVLEWAGEEVLAELIAALPPAKREAVLLDHVAAGMESGDDDILSTHLIKSHTGPWSEKLSRALVEKVRSGMRSRGKNRPYWTVTWLLKELAPRVPPAMLGEMSRGWPEGDKEWEQWKGSVDEFLATVQFRKEMLEEIRK